MRLPTRNDSEAGLTSRVMDTKPPRSPAGPTRIRGRFGPAGPVRIAQKEDTADTWEPEHPRTGMKGSGPAKGRARAAASRTTRMLADDSVDHVQSSDGA